MAQDNPTIIQDPTPVQDAATPVQDSAPVVESAPARVEQYVPILPGDDLATLAARWNTTADAIISRNDLNPDYIFPWQWVFV